MAWKEDGVQKERERFVEDYRSEEWTMAELCRFYGLSRKTGYKWVGRYEAQGWEGLKELSRAPHRHPNEVSSEVQQAVLEVRAQHAFWGAAKIRAELARKRAEEKIPAASTIGEILKRNGASRPAKRRRRSRNEGTAPAGAEGPNAVWCADFKGWFRTADGRRIDPFTVSDHYSRYLFRCQAVEAADYVHTKAVLEAAFREYGLPERLRTDNGAPFGSNGESGLTKLAVWWIKLGIVPEHIQPGCPQQNGRHERMHRTLKQETASPPAQNRKQQQQRFDRFRREYNEERPHQALGQKPPTQCYRTSERAYPERIREVQYTSDREVRRVSPAGQIRWEGEYVFIGHALEGEPVGLEQVDERHWRVWFSFYELGTLEQGRQRIRRPARKEAQTE
jgi:putative transposase